MMALGMWKWNIKGFLFGALCVAAFAGSCADVRRIAVPDAATSVENTAARELAEALARITGEVYDIVSESRSEGADYFVGATRCAEALAAANGWTAFAPDEIRRGTVNGATVLTGDAVRGVLYSVESFLEDVAGVRWWTAAESDYPNRPGWKPGTLAPYRYAPPFRFRETFYRDGLFNVDFKVRMKSNTTSYTGFILPPDEEKFVPPEKGGNHKLVFYNRYGRRSAYHSFFAVLPPDKYFKDHPDWYTQEPDGHRWPGQLCVTNPEMTEEYIRETLKLLRESPDCDAIQVSQNDTDGVCRCARCRAFFEREGKAWSGPYIDFVNKVAEAVEKEFPNVMIDTFAYRYTRKAPKTVRPRHNVLVRLCDIECAFNRPLDGSSYAVNRAFMEDLRDWGGIASGNLYVWDYQADFHSYILPHPNLHVFADNIRTFRRYGAVGVFEQGDAMCEAGDFAPLKQYVTAHLLWNPDRDDRQLAKEFVEGYYGRDAAPHILKALAIGERAVTPEGVPPMGCYHTNVVDWVFRDAAVAAIGEMEQALAAAEKAGGPYARRVRLAKLSWDHAKILNWERWGFTDGHSEAIATWKKDLADFGVRAHRETKSPQLLPDYLKQLKGRPSGGEELSVRMLPGENWWGLGSDFGRQMPFNGKTGFRCDLRKSNYGNQTQSILVSDRGRVLYCVEPVEAAISNGMIRFVSDRGRIVLTEKAGKTLPEAFRFASKTYFPPTGRTPDLTFFSAPQYNTWIELTYHQNEKDILAYAQSMLDHGLPPGIFMIDDTWQLGYGTWEFDARRFPNPKGMVEKLHGMGFKVLVWVCPFVSMDSPAFRLLEFGASTEDCRPRPVGGLTRDGKTGDAAVVRWWNGRSALLDLSHPNGRQWFTSVLDDLRRDYGIDAFKFDGGGLVDYAGVTAEDASLDAAAQNGLYAMLAADYPGSECRSAFGLAGQPVVMRLIDKHHTWEALQRLVPDMLAAGLTGYPFICPDMIGGGLWTAFLPGAPFDPELFIRSAQVHALCPMMQISASPWRVLDEPHQKLFREAVGLRQKFADLFVDLARKASKDGEPIMRNLEYAFPGRGWGEIKDEFLMGDTLLVAPQLQKGATSRDVVIPPGTWRADDGTVYEGPATVRVETPLSRIPYFTLDEAKDPWRWRGFLLDEARHFFGKEKVKELLDIMAEKRMNVFHWHLTDDQGWRIDLPGLPELVRHGAVRPCSPKRGENAAGDGVPYGPHFYTADDVREIVRYAADRGIDVMPEFDVPGHVRALLASHPEFACAPRDELRHPRTAWGIDEDVLCIGNTQAVRFVEKVVDGLCELFPFGYFHIGGDECPKARWQACAKCRGLTQAAFTRHMVDYLASKGRTAVAWDEVLADEALPRSTVIQCWHDRSVAVRAARAGHPVIVSRLEETYLSIPPGEDGDTWPYRKWVLDKKMRITVDGIRAFDPMTDIPADLRGYVLGGECCAWTEEMASSEELDFKVKRRLAAFGEALSCAKGE